MDDAADNNNKNNNNNNEAGKIYSIDAAKNMKYEELFPVETKKFGYDPKFSTFKTVEDALDDRVKKKADRYCKWFLYVCCCFPHFGSIFYYYVLFLLMLLF